MANCPRFWVLRETQLDVPSQRRFLAASSSLISLPPQNSVYVCLWKASNCSPASSVDIGVFDTLRNIRSISLSSCIDIFLALRSLKRSFSFYSPMLSLLGSLQTPLPLLRLYRSLVGMPTSMKKRRNSSSGALVDPVSAFGSSSSKLYLQIPIWQKKAIDTAIKGMSSESMQYPASIAIRIGVLAASSHLYARRQL